MTRTLRGAWARRGTLLPLSLLTATVVAGVTAADAFAREAGVSTAAVVPLLLLGLVAVPATGQQLAAARREEVALARLRGLTSGPLYAVLALEPLLALSTGALAGALAGAGAAAAAGAWWLGGPAVLGVGALTWVVCVVAVGLAAVLVGMAAALRESLAEQVRPVRRPRGASVAVLFWHVLVMVAAGVAAYRSAVAGGADLDWVVLAGPALVGLAVGQLAVWLVRVLAVPWATWSTGRGLPGYLASRRLARLADGAAAVRLVVAATVVCTVSATGAGQVADWADGTARVTAAGPVQVPVEGDVRDALRLTRELDPEGRHLVAAAVVPGEGSVVARRAYLDTTRYDAVLGEFLAGTPAAGAADRLGELAGSAGSTLAVGDRVTVTVAGVSPRGGGLLRPRVQVRYTDGSGADSRAEVDLALAPDGAPVTGSAPVDCAEGCLVTGIVLDRTPGDAALPYLLTGLDLAGVDGLAQAWRSTGRGQLGAPGGPLEVDGGLLAVGDQGRQEAEPEQGPRTPVLATPSASWPDGPPLVDDPGGEERPAEVVARVPALPLVGADGVLADLPLTATGAPPTVPLAEVMVLAAADTPGALLRALAEETGGEPRTLADVRRTVARDAGADQARAYALVAGFCLLVAVLVAGASVARQRAEHRREVAVLRLLRVPGPAVRRSGRLEVLALALAALVAAAAGGLLAVRLLLANLALVRVPEHAFPLRVAVAPVTLGLAALLAGALLLAVTGRARRVRAGAGPPALLREEAAG